MKKVLKLILSTIILFLGINKINALNYSEWSEEYPKGVSEILIESEVRYKWYIENKINEEYLLKDEGTQKYIDEKDIKINKYNQKEKPEEKDGRVITPSEYDKTITKEDVTHIKFQLLNPIYNFYISEIEVLDKSTNELIKYKVESNDINYDFINDKDYETKVQVTLEKELYLNLNNSYNLDDLKITIYYKLLSNTLIFPIEFLYQKDNMIESYSPSIPKRGGEGTYKLEPQSTKETYGIVNEEGYSVEETLYKKYDIERTYTEVYLLEKEGYIKDETLSKKYYRYITDKKVIVDINNNIIRDMKYCQKHACFVLEVTSNKPRVIIKNPQTSDNINEILFQMFTSSSILITIIILVIIKIYNKRKLKKKNLSTFVETL